MFKISFCLPKVVQDFLVWSFYKFSPLNTPKEKSPGGLNQADMEATQRLYTERSNVH